MKALFRKGKVSKNKNIERFQTFQFITFIIDQILEAKGEINAAIPVLQKGATLDPDSKAIQQVSLKKKRISQKHF